jgi:hypothetical protein
MAAELFTASLMRATDANGTVLPGAKWLFYSHGTTTPLAVYADSDLATSLGGSVQADGGGKFQPIYFDASRSYRAVLKDRDEAVTIYDVDPANLAGTVSDIYPLNLASEFSYTATDGQTDFSAPGAATAAVTAYVNGVRLAATDVSIDGTTVTLAAQEEGDEVLIVVGEENVLARPVSFVGPFTFTSLGDSVPASGSYFGLGGNSLSFQTMISSPSGAADSDNQRASVLFRSITTDDGNSEEQTLCVLTNIETGYAPEWAQNTAYSVGDNVRITAENNVYRCVTAGTSANSGDGPSGKVTGVVDGTVVWDWINDAAIEAKVGIYSETLISPGAGHSWGLANNVEIESGTLSDFIVGAEFDLTNNCGTDSEAGGLNKYNLYIVAQGANTSTAFMEFGTSAAQSVPAAKWCIHFSPSDKLAENAVIGIDASAPVGIGFGTEAGGVADPTFTDAAIKCESTAPKAISLAGTYSSAAIEVDGDAPAAISLIGTFASHFIDTDGTFEVDKDSNVVAAGLRCTLATPASASAAGTAGDIRWDANYIYVCTATDTWKRTAISTW